MNNYRSVTVLKFRKAPHVVADYWDSALEAKADVVDLRSSLARDPELIDQASPSKRLARSIESRTRATIGSHPERLKGIHGSICAKRYPNATFHPFKTS